MTTTLDASLFVTTYNMPQQLALVCTGVERQTTRNLEIFFCDDGSGAETKNLIAAFKERFAKPAGIPVHHLWQENKGFRKCRILNEALRQSTGRIAIFLDGDCIPHPDYVADHLREQEEGRFLAGRRVELGPKISAWLTPECVRDGFLDFPGPRILWSAGTDDVEFLNRFIRIPFNRLRALVNMDRIAG
ncbi:glycosyltransferase, partial [Bdellovibrionota bacterium FG-2]